MSDTSDSFVPLVQPTLPPWEEVASDLQAVWNNPRITVGEFCRRFERGVEARLEVPHAVAVSSCTAGLMLGVKALELTGEVILPPFTWTASGLALLWNGVDPVFADIEPGTYTLSVDAAEAAITERTTGIMPVNVFGTSPDLDGFCALAERYGLKLLYDTAQGLGATYKGQPVGGFGDIEVFSMSPTKVLTAVEGGVLTTRDDGLAQRLRQMRDYGKSADAEDIEFVGLSARQSELHGLVAYHSLQRMDELVGARMQRVHWYRERLGDLPGISLQTLPPDQTSTGNYVALFVSDAARISREALKKALADRGIQTKKYFSPALHLQTAFAPYRSRFEGRLPVAERASAEGLALPLYSHMTQQTVERVCAAVLELAG